MGPRSLNRGIAERMFQRALPGPASMGPRSLNRGIRIAANVFSSPAELQWGRDLSIAESLLATDYRNHRFWLQWGRDLSIAESARSLSYSIISILEISLRAARKLSFLFLCPSFQQLVTSFGFIVFLPASGDRT